MVPEALLEQSRQTQRLFNLVMGSIASISLLVGGIGIMNIMLASVLERTREIGVRRAVGARRLDIQLQFVTESFTISLIGGVAGILLGIGLARGIARLRRLAHGGQPRRAGARRPRWRWRWAWSPASTPRCRRRELDPIESLRYE